MRARKVSLMILPTGVHPIPAAGDRKVNGSLARVTVRFANCLVISRSYLKELQRMDFADFALPNPRAAGVVFVKDKFLQSATAVTLISRKEQLGLMIFVLSVWNAT